METKMIKCPNCGADFDVHRPKCPYCSFMNPEGAEEQYLNELEKTRQELDRVDELAAENVKDEVRESTKLIGNKLVQIGIAVIFLGCLGLAMTRYYACNNKSSELTAEEMQWQREAFSQLDSLYEAGDYETLISQLNDYSEQDHRVWDWEHYNFISWYQEYLLIKENLDFLEREGQCSEELGNILFRNMFEFYDLNTETAVKAGVQTQKDAEVLKQCREEVIAAIHERLRFSDEDITGFYDKIHDSNGYLDLKECEKVVKDHYQQFR